MTADLLIRAKACTKCGISKPLEEFHREKSRPDGHRSHCKDCTLAYQKDFGLAYRAAHGEPPRYRYSHDHECEGCGRKWSSREPGTRYCSTACANKARSWSHACLNCGNTWVSGRADGNFCSDRCLMLGKRAASSRLVVYTGPAGPPERPVATLRPLRKRWYAGECPRCGEWFIHDQPQTRACSARCAQRMSKEREKIMRRAAMEAAFVEPVSRYRIFVRDNWTCMLCGKPVKRNAVAPHPLAPTIDHIIPVGPRFGGTHERANVQCAHFLCNSIKGDRYGGQMLLIG